MLAVAVLGLACDSGPANNDQPALTREELLNPESCKDCHPKYYREWSGSMHAYAMKDPVFIAMNKRGQEETNGALGNFCVNCHAPMAVREGAISNFADLSTVPDHLQGVTCYFCHNAVDVGPDHFNANIAIANDDVMRANIRNPLQPTAHKVGRSEFHDATSIKSSMMCGTCHDIVTPAPKSVHLERTLQEYLPSLIAQPGPSFNSCQTCHMRTGFDEEPVAVSTGREGEITARRPVHEHLFPAVDVSLTDDMPHQPAMRAAVEACELANSLSFVTLSREGPINYKVELETQAAHNQPSGATQDRRMWVEILGYDAAGAQVFDYGLVGEGQSEGKTPETHPCMFRDVARDETGKEVHMFWEATNQPVPNVTDSILLQPATAASVDHTKRCEFRVGARVERFVVTVKMRPVSVDVLNDLVGTGHLDAAVIQRMPTFMVTQREFQLDAAANNYTETAVSPSDCSTYQCLLNPDPNSTACKVSSM
ncbi:MAG: ammonia-forming cytochrome c nitrite reductase subunit c552 [Polyangiales bacterium]